MLRANGVAFCLTIRFCLASVFNKGLYLVLLAIEKQ